MVQEESYCQRCDTTERLFEDEAAAKDAERSLRTEYAQAFWRVVVGVDGDKRHVVSFR